MAREYINSGIISKESDIFSLGVIILEIVTGCRRYPSDTGLYSSKYMDFITEVRMLCYNFEIYKLQILLLQCDRAESTCLC